MVRHDYITGVQYWMANDASRPFNLSDDKVLAFSSALQARNPVTATSNNFMRDFDGAHKGVQRGVSTNEASVGDRHWIIWEECTTQLDLDPLLQTVSGKVPIIQINLH